MKKNILEIACFSAEDAITAQNAGADRIELCEDYSVGGITPNENVISFARKNLQIDLFVMIRPRGGNFIYSNEEFEEMKEQILLCKEINCNGVVFGMLNERNQVDQKRNSELVQLAKPMQCTFHKAFDETDNALEALEDIIACGFTRILTSGQKPTATEGVELIRQLIEKAKSRIVIIPGGGVRSENISELLEKTGATEIHSAAINKTTLKINSEEIKSMKEKLTFIR